MEPAECRVWVRAPDHVRSVDGVSYDAVPTEYLQPPSPVQEVRAAVSVRLGAGEGWRPGSRPGRCRACRRLRKGAGRGAPVLPLDRALEATEQPGLRLCSLCGAAAEPVAKGFDHGFG